MMIHLIRSPQLSENPRWPAFMAEIENLNNFSSNCDIRMILISKHMFSRVGKGGCFKKKIKNPPKSP